MMLSRLDPKSLAIESPSVAILTEENYFAPTSPNHQQVSFVTGNTPSWVTNMSVFASNMPWLDVVNGHCSNTKCSILPTSTVWVKMDKIVIVGIFLRRWLSGIACHARRRHGGSDSRQGQNGPDPSGATLSRGQSFNSPAVVDVTVSLRLYLLEQPFGKSGELLPIVQEPQ